jgi:hypothetical protein
MTRAIWAPVRAGFSRRNAHAKSRIVSGERGFVALGAGFNASNPPDRHVRIQRSRLFRLTRTAIPSGPGWDTAARARTARPRSAWFNDGSAASRISA